MLRSTASLLTQVTWVEVPGPEHGQLIHALHTFYTPRKTGNMSKVPAASVQTKQLCTSSLES